MLTVIVSHEVKNFPEWKKVFDADENRRAGYGIKLNGLYTSSENPNRPTMIFEFPDNDLVQKFMNDPDLKEKMESGGVISAPEVKVLNKVNWDLAMDLTY